MKDENYADLYLLLGGFFVLVIFTHIFIKSWVVDFFFVFAFSIIPIIDSIVTCIKSKKRKREKGIGEGDLFDVVNNTNIESIGTDYVREKERLAYIKKIKIEKEVKIERKVEQENIDNMDGVVFERYAGKLLKHKGYSVRFTPVTNDKGVDIVATRDHIRYAIQVKRYSSAVSRRAVSDAVAGKSYYHCSIPMVITNNYFTKGAKELAKATKCKLIDRNDLTNWITDFQSSKKT